MKRRCHIRGMSRSLGWLEYGVCDGVFTRRSWSPSWLLSPSLSVVPQEPQFLYPSQLWLPCPHSEVCQQPPQHAPNGRHVFYTVLTSVAYIGVGTFLGWKHLEMNVLDCNTKCPCEVCDWFALLCVVTVFLFLCILLISLSDSLIEGED